VPAYSYFAFVTGGSRCSLPPWVPKGEIDRGEKPLDAAMREFREETGMEPPDSELLDLGQFEQSKRKRIVIWAAEGDLDPSKLESITFELEWPPNSGKKIDVPEVDYGDWCDIPTASDRVIKGQVQVIEALERKLIESGALSKV